MSMRSEMTETLDEKVIPELVKAVTKQVAFQMRSLFKNQGRDYITYCQDDMKRVEAVIQRRFSAMQFSAQNKAKIEAAVTQYNEQLSEDNTASLTPENIKKNILLFFAHGSDGQKGLAALFDTKQELWVGNQPGVLSWLWGTAKQEDIQNQGKTETRYIAYYLTDEIDSAGFVEEFNQVIRYALEGRDVPDFGPVGCNATIPGCTVDGALDKLGL